MSNIQNISAGEKVKVLATSRQPGQYGYEQTMGMIGLTCEVSYVSDDEGILVFTQDKKDSFFFAYAEVDRVTPTPHVKL